MPQGLQVSKAAPSFHRPDDSTGSLDTLTSHMEDVHGPKQRLPDITGYSFSCAEIALMYSFLVQHH